MKPIQLSLETKYLSIKSANKERSSEFKMPPTPPGETLHAKVPRWGLINFGPINFGPINFAVSII